MPRNKAATLPLETPGDGGRSDSAPEGETGRLSRVWVDELLDPKGWEPVLETFAVTMKLAVAMTDPQGRLLGKCHNPQLIWIMGRDARPAIGGECPFCLGPPASCGAVAAALSSNEVVMVEDQAGMAHVAVPLSLGGQQLGTLIAGQVFSRYPEPLRLQRVARDFGISKQTLWHQATQQVPIPRATLRMYADMLRSLGDAFLGQRNSAILQRRLAQTSQRYLLFFEGVKDRALYTMNREGRITSWNLGAERLFGYTEAEIIGRKFSCLLAPADVSEEAERQILLDADASGWVEYEGWRVRKDGTRFFAAGVLAGMGDGDTREYGRMVQDVTELRRTERDQQETQRLEGIGVLAGGIAHDFNNLLTGISASLSLAKTSLAGDSPAYPMVEVAEQSAERAAELVAQLLAYAGKGKFSITRFDLSTLIADLLPLLGASIPKSIKLELALAAGLPWIEADASQIRQIVMNLVINGAESIDAEGGTVWVTTAVKGSGEDIFMEIRDSGSGMSEITKARMFDPFFTTKFTGRGLGLAAVAGIVRSHKGTIDVESIPGRGTTFTVSFPTVQSKIASAPALLSAIPSPVTGTILVVDDEPILRKLAAAILGSAGYSVLLAANGQEGVEVFRKNEATIAAVLLDMTMPVMGGCKAFELIRQIAPRIPIIVSSGFGESVTREELGGDAIAGYLQKPYGAAKLVDCIGETLQLSRPGSDLAAKTLD